MSELSFQSTWQGVGGNADPLTAATFANLDIRIDGQPLIQALDWRHQTVSPSILVPLYPMAEWLVMNWWHLTTEVAVPPRRDATSAEYLSRHSLAYADHAFHFPDVRFLPNGKDLEIEVHRSKPHYGNFGFINEARHRISVESFQQAVRALVEQALAGVRSAQGGLSPLQTEWEAIEAASNEERTFCRRTAQLGLDPYDLSNGKAELIVALGDTLPTAFQDEFFRAAEPEHLQASADWLKAIGKRTHFEASLPDSLNQLRKTLNNQRSKESAWQMGYRIAREFRESLELDPKESAARSKTFLSMAQLKKVGAPPSPGFEAVVGISGQGALEVFAPLRRRAAQVFLQARSLLEAAAHGGASLMTSAQTQTHQRSRAFAAELLAPADGIRQRLAHGHADEDRVTTIAEDFGVSDRVVRWQIVNHDLARLPLFS